MRYIFKKGLFGGKIVDEKGKAIELNRKEIKAKSSGDGFVFESKTSRSQELKMLEQEGETLFRGVAFDKTGCLVDVQTGKITEPFIDYYRGYMATLDGKLKTVDKKLNVKDTGYMAVTGSSRYADHDVLHSVYDIYLHGDAVVAKDVSGKFGVLKEGKVICPFVFDSQEIRVQRVFEAEDGRQTISFSCDGREVLVDNDGKVIEDRPMAKEGYQSIFSEKENEQFVLYDQENDKSVIYKHDRIKGTVEKFAELDGRVLRGFKNVDGETVYISTINDKEGVVSKDGETLVNHQYDYIGLSGMNGSKDVLLCVENKTGENNIYGRDATQKGVYSMGKQKEIVAPKYSEIDFEESGIGADGLMKFFVNNGEYWGVVDEKGKVDVPFEYVHSTLYRVHTYRYQRNSDGDYDYGKSKVEELEIEDKNGNKCYLNISQPNIIASAQEMKDVEAYYTELAESVKRDRAKKASMQAKQQAEEKRRVEAEYRAQKEEDSTIAAIGATILTGSPIAGMIVKGMMDDDDGPSMD